MQQPYTIPYDIASFTRSDTGVVIDSEPLLNRFLFAPFVVRVHTGSFAFPFYTPTKQLIPLHIKYKAVLFP